MRRAWLAALGWPDPIGAALGSRFELRGERIFSHTRGGGEERNFVASTACAEPSRLLAAGCDFFRPLGERFRVIVGGRRTAPEFELPGWRRSGAVRTLHVAAPTGNRAVGRQTGLRLQFVGEPASLAMWMDIVEACFGPAESAGDPVAAASCPQLCDGYRRFVAWDGAEPVGAAALYRAGKTFVLTDFCVLRAHRGCGRGTAFVEHLRAQAAMPGGRGMVAMALQEQDAFYLRAGFSAAWKVAVQRCTARLPVF